MMNVPLELGQLWRCPVEWCTVWKGSVSDCLWHLHGKHGGSQYVAVKNLGKFFPPWTVSWTVSRDIWLTAIRPDVSGIAVDVRLFHEAGCHLVHKYRVYKDPFPHQALRGGGGEVGGQVINRLLALVGRAMAIAQLTHHHSCIRGATRRGPRGMFSMWPTFTGDTNQTPIVYCSPVFWVVTRQWSSRQIRSRWTVQIFRHMTRFALIFRRKAIWISLLRSRMCVSPLYSVS